MPRPKRIGDLDINQDLPHESLEWKIERVGWVMMSGILLAALLGLLGKGCLSHAILGKPNTIFWVEYDRFERYQAPTMLRLHLGPGAAQGDKARIWVSREYVENIELHHIDPEPDRVEAKADRFLYTFNVPDASAATAVTFYLEGNKYGRLVLDVGLEAGPQVNASQFFYP